MHSGGAAFSARGENMQPPDALLSRGLEVHPLARATTWRSGSTVPTSRPATAGASPPTARCASGSARSTPASTCRSPTERLARDSSATRVRYQGNWIPHALRNATDDGVFFVGDSAGHCLPLTAEGIRTALYFGLACGRELRAVVDGRQPQAQALARYHAFSAGHSRAFYWLLKVQRLVPRVAPRALGPALRTMEPKRFIDWSFGHYLGIAHPNFVGAGHAPALAACPGTGSSA